MTKAHASASDSPASKSGLSHLSLKAQGLGFYVEVNGPADGPLVMLLHGFPEHSYAWRHQSRPLAAAGFRVAMPDQRGYGRSEKPPGRSNYQIGMLAEDVLGLARALGYERFAVVGHDWGGLVAWHLATHHFAYIERLVIMNAPHPSTLLRYALKNPMQLVKSSYIGLFQLPGVPELALSAANYRALALALTGTARAGTFSELEMKVYREAWAQPGALTSMLNWYRAMPLAPPAHGRRVSVPARVIWGDRDRALEPGLAEEAIQWCDKGEAIHLPAASHWLHHEEPARVNELLLAFLKPLLA